MDFLNICCIVITLNAIILCIINTYHTKKTMKQLYNILDCAIKGEFTENTFDESMLSALENKLNMYLKQNHLSQKNIKIERDKIKTLISDISHQIKIPISNILLYSSLLQEENLNKDIKVLVEPICNQGEKLKFLIEALISLSRLETGIISVKPSKNSIKQLIDNVLSQIQLKAIEKEIEIITSVEDYLATFDMKWTREVVFNILENSIKYTPKGGRVEITIKSYELFCCINIKDNGIGIKEEDQSKIFTRFYRCESVQQIEGVGIGLFLARKILKDEGGYVKVSSKLGEGATFSIFLPREN